MRGRFAITIVALALLVTLFEGCEPSDDSGSGGSSSSDVPDCSNGSEAGVFEGDVPSWIQDNFTCVKVTADGDELVIETRNLPPYTSWYYGSDSDRFDDTEPEDDRNPNRIEEQDVTMTVTSDPEIAGSPSDTALGVVGIAVDGVVIYNDEANPPDLIGDEAYTFDVHGGHPQNNGVYHYHTEPPELTDDDDNLVGIAADGFPIFGRRDRDDTSVDFTGTDDNWHDDDDTALFEGENMPHYHIVEDNLTETTSHGDQQLRYMVSSEYGGTPGMVDGGL